MGSCRADRNAKYSENFKMKNKQRVSNPQVSNRQTRQTDKLDYWDTKILGEDKGFKIIWKKCYCMPMYKLNTCLHQIGVCFVV